MNYDLRLIVSFLTISFIPSFFFVTYELSSLSVGLLVASLIVLLLNYEYLSGLSFKLRNVTVFLICFFTIFFNASYNYFLHNETKPMFSIILLLVFISGIVFSKSLERVQYEKLSGSILICILLLIIMGWLKLIYTPNCCNYQLLEKSVFPFSEESHYALILGIFAVTFSVAGNKLWLLFIGINLFLLAIVFPSLTMLLFSFLVLFSGSLRFKPLVFKFFIILIPFLLFPLFIFLLDNYEYFSSRLTFDDVSNLTTLVYFQGWHMAYLNLIETNGLGLGFQMLGLSTTHLSHYTDLIFKISGKENNIMDGGFLAAKLISEFGVIGVIISLFYGLFLIKFIFYANKIWSKIRMCKYQDQKELLKKKLLLLGILFSFLIEFYFRGYGYFSPSIFLVILSLVLIPTVNKQLKLY